MIKLSRRDRYAEALHFLRSHHVILQTVKSPLSAFVLREYGQYGVPFIRTKELMIISGQQGQEMPDHLRLAVEPGLDHAVIQC
jgi:hypothetical protein